MCVHYLGPNEEMLEGYSKGKTNFSGPYRDIFPGKPAPAYILVEEELELREFLWGFPVDWARGPVFNTRLESAMEGKEMWRESFESRRLILPSLGFYEPHFSELVPSPRTGQLIKQQYLFDRGGKLFFMAGIYRDGYFSLMTTIPNSTVSLIHDRMPLVLEDGEVELWLKGDASYFLDRQKIELRLSPKYPQPLSF